jgi:hypothetical protein
MLPPPTFIQGTTRLLPRPMLPRLLASRRLLLLELAARVLLVLWRLLFL